MAQMYKIVLQCPVTSRLLETGIRTSGREALNNNVFRNGRSYCHHCGEIHAFDENAFLDVDERYALTDTWRPNP